MKRSRNWTSFSSLSAREPESPLLWTWTSKSARALSAELFVRHGIRINHESAPAKAPASSLAGAQRDHSGKMIESRNAGQRKERVMSSSNFCFRAQQ